VSHPSQDAPSLLGIRVNGEARTVRAGASVADLVAALGLAGRKLAVAVNREVVPRARHALHRLAEGDRVVILEAVGGG
jgi:sulfur carrier protein